ncbi:hypothetical protein FACS1894188_01410 [Clostridia bacterium]|nr:hypothetical protein FACS1894188_01410 [Clostridia bacterium]
MFFLKSGNIIPSERIGVIKLNMTFEEVIKIVDEFEIEDLPVSSVVVCGDVKIWVNKEKNTVTQISVYGSFEGKYADKIGIGSSLDDVTNLLHSGWTEDLYVYFINGVQGMCLEHGDTEDENTEDVEWNENTALIKVISIFVD